MVRAPRDQLAPPQAQSAAHLRRGTTLGVVAIAAFAVGVFVAILGGTPPARQASGTEWLVQVALLIAVMLLLLVRIRRKG